jgi:hypothetical protein
MPACPSDCDRGNAVTIDELVLAVGIALGNKSLDACTAADRAGDGAVEITDLIAGVGAAQNGCPSTPTAPPEATPSGTATSSVTKTASATPTPIQSSTSTTTASVTPTPSPTFTASLTPTGTPTATPCVVQVGRADGLRVDAFESDNGTHYFVVSVAAEVAAGAQMTSFAIASSSGAITKGEAPGESGRDATSLAAVAAGALLPMDRLWRTEIISDLSTTVIDPAVAFDPCANQGQGLLLLPDGRPGVAFDRGGAVADTEPLYSIAVPSDSVPKGIHKLVRRRMWGQSYPGPFEDRGDSIVFPFPGPAQCAGSDVTRPCGDDAECEVDCGQFGQGCCGQVSVPPTCGGGPILCDVTGSAPADQCNLEGDCQSGGTAPNQNVTLDEEICSRIGNPESQPDSVDGVFLRSKRDLIVFVAAPEDAAPDGPADSLTAVVAGFLVDGGPLASRRVLRATSDVSEGSPPSGCGATSEREIVSRRARIGSQVFVSTNGKVYFVLSSNPQFPNDVGTQVTSLMMAEGTVSTLIEASGGKVNDRVRTAVSALQTGGLLAGGNLRRTSIVTNLSQNFIENVGNPLNGVFDPDANNEDGLLTLPGGTRTVSFLGTGTEPVQSVSQSEGAGLTFVPGAVLSAVSRRLGAEQVLQAPTIVFPHPFVDSTRISRGSRCLAGSSAGLLCDPNDDASLDPCVGGFGCKDLGGETAEQNVTLDDTIGSRIGNPVSQGATVDGFFLPHTTSLIVFMADAGSRTTPFSATASGFLVTGTCSNQPTPCAFDLDCPGSTCTHGLTARNVVAAAGSDFRGALRVQSFESGNGKLYFLLRSDPVPGSIGVQVTSIGVGIGQANQLVESPPSSDPVTSSLSLTTSPIPLGEVRRTALLTGFSSNVIENTGNPLTGIFDAEANNADGLLILPGATRTVTFDGSGTEPLVTIDQSTGAGWTLVPVAANISVTRRLGASLFVDVPATVFPNPVGSVVTSNSTSGEAAGQNVTLDDTLNSRVGNPASQGEAIDGFFIPNTTGLIVFMVDGPGRAGPVAFSASGFIVTGTCSDTDTPCDPARFNLDCVFGTCTQALGRRNVIAATGDRS